MKIQARCLIDNLRAFRNKEEERRLRACGVVGVGEAVPDQHRADSLNTGWVKVPVKFPALAVVGSERGLGAPKQAFFPEIAAYGWYPSFCHSVNNANGSAVQYGPPDGMEGGSPSCGESAPSTLSALSGSDMQV